MDIKKFAIPEIIFGRGSVEYVALCAQRLGAEKVFVVSDKGLFEIGWVDKLLSILNKHNLKWVYYDDVVTNPRDYQIEKGANLYLKNQADVVIALGGGSPMDAAKGIALVASNGGTIHNYEGANRIHKPLPPMVFLPTTAGSGADISQFAIITDTKRHVKMSIISRTLVPNISIIDPLFLITKPKDLIFSSAIDAFSHAIESYVSLISSPFTELQSLEAIRLISKFLPIVAKEKEVDIKILEKLSTASTFAAIAFSNAGLGAVHALAHAIGGMYDVSHGILHPILLPPVMKFNFKECKDKMFEIAKIIIGKKRKNVSSTVEEALEMIKKVSLSLGMKIRLKDILPENANIGEICRKAINDVCLLTNPIKVNFKDLYQICEEVW